MRHVRLWFNGGARGETKTADKAKASLYFAARGGGNITASVSGGERVGNSLKKKTTFFVSAKCRGVVYIALRFAWRDGRWEVELKPKRLFFCSAIFRWYYSCCCLEWHDEIKKTLY